MGLVPTSVGWFVMNVRDGRWFDKPGQGHILPAQFPRSQPTRYRDGLLPG